MLRLLCHVGVQSSNTLALHCWQLVEENGKQTIINELWQRHRCNAGYNRMLMMMMMAMCGNGAFDWISIPKAKTWTNLKPHGAPETNLMGR